MKSLMLLLAMRFLLELIARPVHAAESFLGILNVCTRLLQASR